jgi:hypothetical protein
MNFSTARLLAGLCLAALCTGALAVLPPLTDAQKQAAAAKKVVADADAEKAKQAMLTSMDGLSARWRARAAGAGLKVFPPVPIIAPMAALSAPTTQAIVPPQVSNPAKP